ncbi:MAG: thiamine diphosphokinase [Coriobacteriales bacterium]|nr:thiamine diphosphokinase [Coriobacteriales bacterium]
MDGHTCYIIGAGEHYGKPPKPDIEDLVIAADGGYTYLDSLGIIPDLIIGDFDSLDAAVDTHGVRVKRLPTDKDDTDTYAAIKEGWNGGFRHFLIYGGCGGRIDHTIANIQCLAYLAHSGGIGYLVDKDVVMTVIYNDSFILPEQACGTASVFAYGDTARGVSIEGLKFTLDDETLSNTYPIGVSNSFMGTGAVITVTDGMLLITYPRDIQRPATKDDDLSNEGLTSEGNVS